MAIQQDKSDEFKILIAKGKEQGYLTFDEINDHLPENIVDPDQIEDIINKINEMGIVVYEQRPDEDALLLAESTATIDEEAAEEAVAALASIDSEFGRTTDPVRMYMREMGSVELLTRQGEIAIAKRIEEGLKLVLTALAQYPEVIASILSQYDTVETGEKRLTDIITGFIDEEIDESQIVEAENELPTELMELEAELEFVDNSTEEKKEATPEEFLEEKAVIDEKVETEENFKEPEAGS